MNDPDFMLNYNLVALAKNHNYFAQLDKFMKDYSRIILSLDSKALSQRLE